MILSRHRKFTGDNRAEELHYKYTLLFYTLKIIQASRLTFLNMLDYFNLQISQLSIKTARALCNKPIITKTTLYLNESFDFIILKIFLNSSFVRNSERYVFYKSIKLLIIICYTFLVFLQSISCIFQT